MIQRIQTVFIFLVVILQSLLSFLPIVKSIAVDGTQLVCKPINEMPLAVLTIISSLVAAISIFLYKNQELQRRVTIFNALVMVGLQAYIVYYLISISQNSATVQYSVPGIFPLISIVLSFLAARSILKDELLIKLRDRIR